jgi:hypothetical protein
MEVIDAGLMERLTGKDGVGVLSIIKATQRGFVVATEIGERLIPVPPATMARYCAVRGHPIE